MNGTSIPEGIRKPIGVTTSLNICDGTALPGAKKGFKIRSDNFLMGILTVIY